MSDVCAPFAAKKITVLGLGVLGRGVGDVEFLAKCGAEIIVTDKKSEQELAESVAKLSQYKNITFRLGGHAEEDFLGRDIIVKAAGVPLDSPEIAAAREAGAYVTMSTALFAKYAIETGAVIVGATGTRGKSTVVHMIHHCVQKAGKSSLLAGNIRGISTLAMLPDVKAGDTVVLELDSWQLQGFGDEKMSPHIAIMTNLMPDHQNYYPSMATYFADKANIFKYQKDGDVLFAGVEISEYIWETEPPIPPLVPPAIPDDWTLKVVGAHNRDNAAFAAAALKELELSQEQIREGLESFEGVEGRLQFVREVGGVKIYNDNNATTPEATILALRTLDEGLTKSIILIAGGADKQFDMPPLVDEMHERCKKVILLAGTGTDKLKKEFDSMDYEVSVFNDLKSAFDAARTAAGQGDIILFSPAFASFGMFKNEYDRNDQFLALVRSL